MRAPLAGLAGVRIFAGASRCVFLWGALSLGLAGCDTYADSLARSQQAFEQSENERALAILRPLEQNERRLSPAGQAHYAYLRGMIDYRIGYRSDARHWLSLADALEHKTPGSLPTAWSKRMGASLRELNEAVFAGGVAALSSSPAVAKKASVEGDDSQPTEDAPAEPTPKPAAKPAAEDE
ncbi:MAG: hypothetical protein ACREJ3_00300 [Polyangiaceae bacterium]